MNLKSQGRVSICIFVLFVIVFSLLVIAIDFNEGDLNFQEIYTVNSSDYFILIPTDLHGFKGHSLNIKGSADGDVIDNELVFSNIRSSFDAVLKLMYGDEEVVREFSVILVEGYLQTRTYTDKNNNNRKIVEIVSNKISFLEKAGFGGNVSESAPLPKPKFEQTTPNTTTDDVPF